MGRGIAVVGERTEGVSDRYSFYFDVVLPTGEGRVLKVTSSLLNSPGAGQLSRYCEVYALPDQLVRGDVELLEGEACAMKPVLDYLAFQEVDVLDRRIESSG